MENGMEGEKENLTEDQTVDLGYDGENNASLLDMLSEVDDPNSEMNQFKIGSYSMSLDNGGMIEEYPNSVYSSFHSQGDVDAQDEQINDKSALPKGFEDITPFNRPDPNIANLKESNNEETAPKGKDKEEKSTELSFLGAESSFSEGNSETVDPNISGSFQSNPLYMEMNSKFEEMKKDLEESYKLRLEFMKSEYEEKLGIEVSIYKGDLKSMKENYDNVIVNMEKSQRQSEGEVKLLEKSLEEAKTSKESTQDDLFKRVFEEGEGSEEYNILFSCCCIFVTNCCKMKKKRRRMEINSSEVRPLLRKDGSRDKNGSIQV